jgi:spore coat polysaccharide biosynthesis protein SpsF
MALKVVAIVQARMGALRLPNKMMLHLHGYPIVEWIYRRLKQSKLVDQIIFALPDTEQDNVLELYLESIGARVCRGSENDLVDRFYKTAKSVSSDQVVRVCADNPLICATEIDRLIAFFKQEQCDYAYNHIPKENRYPDGLGAEICSMQLLEEIHQKAVTSEHREHLFNTIWDNGTDYIIRTFDPADEIAHPELKLDLDTMDDYQRLLEKPFRIDMSASEIIQTALKHKENPTT